MSGGWDAFGEAVAQARALVAAEAPNDATAAEGEAYVTRVAAVGLGGAVLGHLFAQDGLSRALPCYGGPNPDYIMRFAPVEAGRAYRLEGVLNGSERIGVGLYSYDGPNGAPLERGYRAFDRAACGPDGRFEIALGAGAEDAGGLAIGEGIRVVLIRVLHRDAGAEPARLRLTGGDEASGLALAMGSNDAALGFVARSLLANVREYLKWTRVARDMTNRFGPAPAELAETVQGDRDTRYFLGGFDLAEGEWLEVTLPADIGGYWSLHAYNFWYEHLQTPGVHDRNVRADDDGRVRIAVGPNLPDEARNRIDTLGRRKGAFVCRVIGTGGCPQAQVRTLI